MIHERLHPRALGRHGTWAIGDARLKVYTISAHGHVASGDLLDRARGTLTDDMAPLPDGATLGFVIVHPGTEGTSILVHWWEQGSVLCHRLLRRLHGSGAPVDVQGRGVVGCVWELAVISAEQRAWRRTMMGATPSPDAYLAETLHAESV
ncbi:MAG: hypothetical protein AAF264_10945 [Pseudomonadota bacterium]